MGNLYHKNGRVKWNDSTGFAYHENGRMAYSNSTNTFYDNNGRIVNNASLSVNIGKGIVLSLIPNVKITVYGRKID